MKIGCTRCPYAGHIELKECVDAYTEVSKYCGMYNHNELGKEKNNTDEQAKRIINKNFKITLDKLSRL